MHLKRARAPRHLPIPRKGTKYVAKALSHSNKGVPVVIAVRDMLHLAHTSKEVKKMVNRGLIKINGKQVRDIRESVRIFNLLEVGKTYRLSVLPTGKLFLEETKASDVLFKIINKKKLAGDITQLNLHDGTNIMAPKNKSAKIGDSVILDFDKKIKDIIHFDKNKNVFILSGGSVGKHGTIKEVNNDKVLVKLDSDKEVQLEKKQVIVYNASSSKK